MRVFVDSSAFIAVLDADDKRHAQARAVWRDGLGGGVRFTTTNYIAVECAAAIQRRLGLHGLQRFGRHLLPAVDLEWVTVADHDEGLSAVLAAARRQLSWVDCVSFAVMRRLGIDVCFTFDPHFAEQGFEPIGGGTG